MSYPSPPIGVTDRNLRLLTGDWNPSWIDLTGQEYADLDAILAAFDRAYDTGVYASRPFSQNRDCYVYGAAIAKQHATFDGRGAPFMITSGSAAEISMQGIRSSHFTTRRSWRKEVYDGWNDLFELQHPPSLDALFVVRSIAVPIGTLAPLELQWEIRARMYPVEVPMWKRIGDVLLVHDLTCPLLLTTRYHTAKCRMYFEPRPDTYDDRSVQQNNFGNTDVQLIGGVFATWNFLNWEPQYAASDPNTERMVQNYARAAKQTAPAPESKPKPKENPTEEDLIVGSMVDPEEDEKDGTA